MEWMYEKYLRNEERERVEREYHRKMSRIACGMRCGPPRYPIRPTGSVVFEAVGGFAVHPNTSREM